MLELGAARSDVKLIRLRLFVAATHRFVAVVAVAEPRRDRRPRFRRRCRCGASVASFRYIQYSILSTHELVEITFQTNRRKYYLRECRLDFVTC